MPTKQNPILMTPQKADTTQKQIIWFNRMLRWMLGIFFMIPGFMYYEKGAWPAIAFGALIFITGFFKPVRCINDTCNTNASSS